MNAKMEIKSYRDIHLDIIGITLPTLEEHESVQLNRCFSFKEFWWILDEKEGKLTANMADSDGEYVHLHFTVKEKAHVRPVLLFKGEWIPIGAKVYALSHSWTSIGPGRLLCNDPFGFEMQSFRNNADAEDATDYEVSDIKLFLEKWLESRLESSK